MQPKSNIVHLPVYQPGKPVEDVKRELGLTEVIKLASNENPYGSSQKAKDAIVSELQNTHIYPDGGSVALTATLAEHLGVQPKQIIFGTGSDEVILMIARAFLVPGDETIMADMTFSVYKHNSQVENAVPIEVPLVNGTHDLDGMLAKVTDKTKIIWICNPNNPTGTIVSTEALERFMQKVPSDVLVVLDEAYCEFVIDPSYPNGLEFANKYKNVVLLRTFSKIYGLASLRIGYAVGDPEVIHSINQVREPFNTSSLAQAAARAALQDSEFIRFCRDENAKGIAYYQEQFDRLGLTYFPAHGNFIMVDVKRPATLVFDALLRKGLITRAGFGVYPNWLRISVGKPEHNEKLIAALEQVLSESAVQA